MNYKRSSLPNGIRLIHAPVPALESATFTVWFGVGSRYEDGKVAGISHFLEHMAFKGGGKYPSAQAVAQTLDAMGAEDNASTSQEFTNYYVRSAVDTLPDAVDVLADTLLSPVLSEKEIEKERGVIIEEINMYEDDPQSVVNNLYGEILFPSHPLGRDIAGTKDTVGAISRQDFIDFRKLHYVPENIVITISGGIDYKKAVEIAQKYFGGLKNDRYHDIYEEFKVDQKSPRVAVKYKKTEQANIIIGFPGNKHGLKSRYAEGLLGIILGSGMSSRLFTEVREKRGLAYSVYANSSHYMDTGEFSAFAGVPIKKASEAIKIILEELYKIASPKHKMTREELQKAKSFFKGHMALSMESTKAINYFLGKEEIKGGAPMTLEEIFEKVESVEIDEIVEVSKGLFIKNKVNLAVVGPYKDQAQFERVLT